MPTVHQAQNNFNSGELSPLLRGRIDQARYYNGPDTCLNWVPLVQGGIRVRGAWKYAGGVKTNSTATYVWPFVFNATNAYILEVGNLYIRIWRANTTTGEPEAVGAPTEVTTTYATADLAALQFRQSADTVYITHASYAPAKLERVSETSWRLTTISFLPPPTAEIKTNLATTMYSSNATGSGRTLTLGAANALIGDKGRFVTTTDGGKALITAVPTTSTYTVDILEGSFKLVADPYASGDWWLLGSPTSHLVYASFYQTGVGETITIAPKDPDLTTNRNTFRSGDVGKYLHFLGGTAKITVFTSAAQIDILCLSAFTESTAALYYAIPGSWTMESDTWTSGRGYPKAATLGEQRLLFAGAAGEPDNIRGSVIGDYQSFARGTSDDMELNYVLASNEVNVINWLAFTKFLLVGSARAEWTLKGQLDTGLTPTAVVIKPETFHGSQNGYITKVGNALQYIEWGGRRIREFLYDYLTDAYESEDLTAFADHLTWSTTFLSSAYQQTPYSILWFVRSDGTLCGLTYYRKEKVLGWSRHTTATAAGTSVIESAAVIPNSVKNRDDLWAVIKRTIDGGTVRYIEVLDWDKYLDCSKSYSGAATATITGLSHLAAESVMIRGTAADGIERIYPAQTVTSDQVTGLSPTVETAEVGIAFTATAMTCRIEKPGAELAGKIKGFGEMKVRCLNLPVLSIGGVRYKAGGVVAGYTAGSVFVIPTGTGAISSSTADGDLIIPVNGYDRDGRVTLTQNLPLGGTVTMLMAEVSVGA